jgi:hypothetical protein
LKRRYEMANDSELIPGRFWGFLMGLLILPCSLAILAQDPPAKPEPLGEVEQENVLVELQKTLIEAAGGKEALEKHSNRRWIGMVLIPGAGIEARSVNFSSREGILWDSASLEDGGDYLQGFHGDVAWRMDPINGARVLSGEAKVQLRRASRLEPLLWLDKDYVSATKIGAEKVGKDDCTVYSLTTTTGSQEKFWVKDENKFLVKIAGTAETMMGKIPMTAQMSAFKKVENIWFSYEYQIQQGIQKMQLTLEQVNYDVEPEDIEITIPAEVQELVDRKKAAKEEGEKKEEEAKEPAPDKKESDR